VLTFPECWDGRNLDSADHQSHMAYSVRGVCPRNHPVPVPQLQTFIRYKSDGGSDISFSSGTWNTYHGDFMNGWIPESQQLLLRACTHASQKCSEVRSK
jgi:hypothetical protein